MEIAIVSCDHGNMSVALPSASPVSPGRPASRTVRNPIDWNTTLRVTAALVIIMAAYRVSLITLFQSMRLDTPLAHLALVPFIAIGLALVVRHRDAGPQIHDRQLDWIVGLFLCTVALIANVVLPARLSSQYWVWRVDLLTLPLFVAGVIALLFGTRTLWKFRFAVLFLMLAWPYPFNFVLDRWLGEFTQTTVWAIDHSMKFIPLADKVAGTSANFVVTKNGHNVQMSIASACSGANGVVGFLLVATAFLLVLEGSKARKIIWLLTGALLVWVLNVVRILSIFWSAGEWGERVAIDGFHPYVGLIVFNVAILAMVLLLKPFGLKVSSRPGRTNRNLPSADGSLPMPSPATPSNRSSTQKPVWGGLLCVTLMATGVGVYNGQLHDYDRIANGLGAPRLADFATSQGAPSGWNLAKTNTYTQYERFFGDGSTWNRYQFVYQGVATTDANATTVANASTDTNASTVVNASAATAPDQPTLTANIPIFVDVINTPDRAALNAYGIEQCYSFHGYSITGRQSVDLGDGLIGGMLTWTSSETALTWTTLYWHWPVNTPSGTSYERVTLVMNDQPTNVFTSPAIDTAGTKQLQLDLNDALRGAGSEEDRTRQLETRKFMIGFARNLVDLRTPAAALPEA